MREIFAALTDILRESSPYLILGFALAGAIHVLLQRFPAVTARLTGTGRRPVFMAALLGAPMPLCSCSVLPAAMSLRRQGASKGSTASFLISVPETDIVSVLITLALIGPFVAVYRPIAAVAAALVTGLAIQAMERRDHQAAVTENAPTTATDCCDAPATTSSSPPARRSWWTRALHYGFVEIFDDIAPQLFLGIVVAALITVFLPGIDPGVVRGHPVLSYLIMLAFGIPMYVCATASTPIAAGLIAGGVSPGAAMVFLLAGPATNVASLVVLRGEFGTRTLAAYVGLIAVTSLALGALLDVLAGSRNLVPVLQAHAHHGGAAFSTVCVFALLAWTALSFHRSRLLPRMRAKVSRMRTTPSSLR